MLVALEARLARGADGRIYSSTGVDGYPFWQPYREIFDTVLVAARTDDDAAATADGRGLVPVEGPGVRVVPLPPYDGPWGYAAVRRALDAAMRAGVASADVLCVRAPGAIAGAAWRARARRPVGVEVVGDPYDALAPGVVRGTLRPIARAVLVRELRTMCAGAAAVSYVARTLSDRYPAGAWSTTCSDIRLEDDAFASATSVAARMVRLLADRDVATPWHLVFVGSLAQRYKGPDVLIEAVARCRAAGLPLTLTIVGDGRHRAALAAEAAASGVGDVVRFTGHLAAGRAVRDVVDTADLFVLPSRTEGLPRALLEAMARGVSGLGTRVGGIPELLPEGRLVAPGDAAALAAALTRVLADRDALAAAAERDHACAREYDTAHLRPRRREFFERLRAAVDDTPPHGTGIPHGAATAARDDRPIARDATPAAPSETPTTPSMSRNAAWALAGNLGYAACQWAVLIAIAKLGSAADVGRFALGLALTAPAMMLANLHLRAIQATDARGEHPFRVYFRLRLLTTSAAFAAIALVAAALGYRGADLSIVVAIAAAKAIESLSDVAFGLLQHAERLRRIACSMLVKGVLSVAAVAVALALGGGLLVASVAMVLAWTTVFLAGDLRAALRLAPVRGVVSPRALATLAGVALPMGCVMALNSLTANVPRYALAASLGPTGLGHFAALVSLLLAATQPLLAVGAAVSPRLARHFVSDPDAYRGVTRRLLTIAALLGIGAVAGAVTAGRAVLTLAYAPEYAAHAPVLVILAVTAAIGFLASAFGVAVTAARRFTPQLVIAVAALGVCALASRTLVPLLGLRGAAFAMLASESTRLVALAAVYALLCAPRRRRADVRRAAAAPRHAPTTAAAAAPIRVLHVFGSMERGGAETRTLEVMRRIDRRRYAFDFCVLSGVPGAYAAEIARLGGRVVPCALRPRRLAFVPRFASLLRRGDYDVVHSHVHHFSGVILAIAGLAGVRTRIAHIRTAHDGRDTSMARTAYRGLTRRLLGHSATTVIGVSESAMEAFFGPAWSHDARRRVIYNGIDRSRFMPRRDRARVREELGIAADRAVVAHVGSFTPAKNHTALVAIAVATLARRPDAVFVLVGDGPARAAITAEVARRGIAHAVRFAGARDDVPRLLAAADLFVLPSLWEGLPGAVLEALASGLPVVASPIPGVLEIARHTPALSTFDRSAPTPPVLVTADPADPAAFAAAIVTVLPDARGDAPAVAPTAGASAASVVAPLPSAFTVEESMERLLACYG